MSMRKCGSVCTLRSKAHRDVLSGQYITEGVGLRPRRRLSFVAQSAVNASDTSFACLMTSFCRSWGQNFCAFIHTHSFHKQTCGPPARYLRTTESTECVYFQYVSCHSSTLTANAAETANNKAAAVRSAAQRQQHPLSMRSAELAMDISVLGMRGPHRLGACWRQPSKQIPEDVFCFGTTVALKQHRAAFPVHVANVVHAQFGSCARSSS